MTDSKVIIALDFKSKEETLESLSKVKVYRTDLHGEITIEVNKKGQLKVQTMHNFYEFTNTTRK